MYVSKTKYKQLCQCPRQLWLSTYRRELHKEDKSAQSNIETALRITELARGLFGPYVDVTVKTPDGLPDLTAMVERTARCMEDGVENICEASFVHDGLYCAVDLLHKERDGYAIYEVKSGTTIRKGEEDGEEEESKSPPKIKEQFDVDVAYQKYVLEHCGISVTGVYIVTLDSRYVRGEELDIHGLFKFHDMTEHIRDHWFLIPEKAAEAKAVLSGADPETPIGPHCFDPHECPFWKHCSAHLPTPSVFDLYRMQQRTKWKHYSNGFVSFEELEQGIDLNEAFLAAKEQHKGKKEWSILKKELDEGIKLNDKQKRQIRFTLQDLGTHCDREAIAEFLKKLRYPLYFLDFEAMQLPIPEFPNSRPYAQIPFQYSLHYIETEGGKLEHTAFLGISGEDPRRAIAEALCRDIPADACVTAYNKAYECNRLKELAELFPDLSEHLLAIRDNIVDLLEPFQEGHYYNRAMGGSFSIKSVLPALFPDDKSLDYHSLDQVHNGTQAMELFPRIKDLPPQEQKTARDNLLAYCHLDTYAMVKVWEKLNEASK